MNLKSERLQITDMAIEMCSDIHKNSLDEDNRRFLPDEVYETMEKAEEAVEWVIRSYQSPKGPFVYPILKEDDTNIGYVQVCSIEEGWEIGYHIAAEHTGNGFATEAVKIFLPEIMSKLEMDAIHGIVLEENYASRKVLEKCGFQLLYQGIGKYQGQERALRRYILWR